MIFDHIGVFVPSLESGRAHLETFLGIKTWHEAVEDPLLKVKVQFGEDTSGIRYEAVAPFGEGDPVTPVLRSGRNILNHVAYRVGDLVGKLAQLREAGGLPLGPPRPAVAFAGKRVAFVLTPLRMVVELIEESP